MPPSSTRNSNDALTRTRRLRRLRGVLTFRKTPRDPEDGFTLIETVAALTILSVGVLGVAAGLLSSMKVSSRSRSETEAIYRAEQEIEIFRIMPAAVVKEMANEGTVPDGGLIENPGGLEVIPEGGDDPTADEGYAYEVTDLYTSWDIQLDKPEEGVMTITVTVDWVDEKGTARSTQIRTLKAGS